MTENYQKKNVLIYVIVLNSIISANKKMDIRRMVTSILQISEIDFRVDERRKKIRISFRS